MQMLRRIVVIVSVVVTACVAVGPSISAPAVAAAASAKKFDPTTIRAIDAIVNATKNGGGRTGHGRRDLGSQARHLDQGLRHR